MGMKSSSLAFVIAASPVKRPGMLCGRCWPARPALRRPREATQNAEDYVSVKSLLRFP